MNDKSKKTVKVENKDAFGHLLAQISKQFSKTIKPLFQIFLEAIDDTLFDFAEKSKSNQNSSFYFESMRSIRDNKALISKTFIKTIESSFTEFHNNQISEKLIHKSGNDEELIKINLIKKSNIQLANSISTFKQGFDSFLPKICLKTRQLPMSPWALVNALSLSFNHLKLDITLNIIIYKLFDRNVLSTLDSSYTTIINQHPEFNGSSNNNDNPSNQIIDINNQDSIDSIAILFKSIVDDRNICDSIKIILSRLQFPFLKISLQNPQYFSRKNAAAKILLNHLSLASIAWEHKANKDNALVKKIENIVTDIVIKVSFDDEYFVNLKKDFDVFLDTAQLTIENNSDSDYINYLGKERILQAKIKTSKLLTKKISNIRMPIILRDILLCEWTSVLVLMHLRYTQDSKDFFEIEEFADILIKYARPNLEIKVTNNDIKGISDMYLKGLKLVAFHPTELENKNQILIKCLNSIHYLQKQKPSNAKTVVESHETTNKPSISNQINTSQLIDESIIKEDNNQIKHEGLDEFYEIVSLLKLGSTLEFLNSTNSFVRAKLSWINPDSGKYLFVNSRGLKITNKTDRALASGLRNKTIRVVRHLALFDRAFSVITNKLKRDN